MIRTIITDIEGTISSAQFVARELYPYADRRLAAFIRERRTEGPVRAQLDATARLAGLPSHDPEPLIARLKAWCHETSPPSPLQRIREMIWEDGLRKKTLRTHLYADAVRVLRDWFENRLSIFTFSSSSARAQDLFFANTRYGDVRPLFHRFFDTTVGPKEDAGAYRRIVNEIGSEAGATLFLSGAEAALDAAREADLRTALISRQDDVGVQAGGSSAPHSVFTSFDDIALARFE